MTEIPPIPQDDLMDVMEMTNKIETYIANVLKDNDKNLAMSALMSACTNSMLVQCKTLDEVVFYRNLFTQILDSSIRSIRIERGEKPS
jgi:hypothetical protein